MDGHAWGPLALPREDVSLLWVARTGVCDMVRLRPSLSATLTLGSGRGPTGSGQCPSGGSEAYQQTPNVAATMVANQCHTQHQSYVIFQTYKSFM
jgi:hypothetical protein